MMKMAAINGSSKAIVSIATPSSAQKIKSGETNDTTGDNTFIQNVTAKTSDEVTAIFRESRPQSGDFLPILGGVRIIRELGEGNMGIVYFAERIDTNGHEDKRIVIKVLKRNEDPHIHNELLERFKQEAEIAQTIGNINNDGDKRFPECFGYFTHQKDGNEMHCIAMEYVPGVDLDTLISSQKKMSLQTMANIARQLVDKLARYHGSGIVHRDIKPGNTMLGERVTIMDPGLAHQKKENQSKPNEQDELTQAGVALGSPVYMSPEAWHDQAGSRDPKRDVFALGITLHQLITGKRPTEIETTDKYLDHYRHRQHVDVVDIDVFPKSENSNQMSFIKSIAELIRLMLHPNPAIRISMADAQKYLQEMVIFPENETGEVPIDRSKDTFDPHEVLESLNKTSSNIELRGYGQKICDFDATTFISRAFTTGENIRALQLSGRGRFENIFKWCTGGTIVAGLLSTLGYIDYLKRQNTFENSPIRVVTTPNLIEVPKPTHIELIKNADGSIASLEINVHAPDSTTSITLDASEAMILELSDESSVHKNTDAHSLEPQYCVAFLCNTEQTVAAAKMIYADHEEMMPDPKTLHGLAYYFTKNDGCSVFYCPAIGLGVTNDEKMTTYTLKDIKEGKHFVEIKILQKLHSMQPISVIQSIPDNIVLARGFSLGMKEKLQNGISMQLGFLLPKRETIIPVSSTEE